MKQFIALITIVYSCILCNAQTTRVLVGDLYYNLSGATASVTTSEVIPSGRWSDGRGPSKYTKETYIIPSYITYEGFEYEVVAIDKWAFAGFREDAYGYATVEKAKGSTAKKIVLPPTIKRIGESAFANCTNLTEMVIPANVESLYTGYEYQHTFYNTPLLREMVYLSANPPTGWHATSKTYVTNLDKYNKPASCITDYSILPILSTDVASFVYTGTEPTLALSNNLSKWNVSFEIPSLEKNVGSYNAIVEAQISNEDMTYNSNVLIQYDITPAQIIVSTDDISRAYGEINPEFVINYTGLVNGETFEVLKEQAYATTTARQTSNVGKYPIKISGAKALNYSFNYLPGELTITKADLEVSVINTTKTYGTPNPKFSLCYYGLKNNETAPNWIEYPTISTTAEQYSEVGSYDITICGGETLNYLITKYNSGVLTVDKADQKLTWNQNLTVQIGSQVALDAVSSAELPVTYDLPQNNIAKLYNKEGKWYIDCLGRGSVCILATQNGDHNYNPAVSINRTIIVIDTGSEPQITLNVENAGTLPSMIAENRKYQIKNLRLIGCLNGTDIKFIREMAGSDNNGNATSGILETLDISGCSIVSGGSSYYRSYYTTRNSISEFMFYNCKKLITLLLPENITSIKDNGLADCDRLSLISIPDCVQSYGKQSFRNNISLSNIPMANNLNSIKDYAFMGCN
ncbi:MAG: leucine-rich repeat protein, partial [Muribaculaceae bacterium]|nr:leucine-rich repeat protein [Muribaculaceae bacterium]